MTTPRFRRTWPAAELAATYPLRFVEPRKALLHAIACPPGSVMQGDVEVTRWEAMPLPEAWPRPVLDDVSWHPGPYDYRPRRVEADPWWVNFADPDLFFGYGLRYFAQDEVQCAEHPGLAHVREALHAVGEPAWTMVGEAPTPVLVRGVERRLKVSQLYGHAFRTADEATLRERAVPIAEPPRHHVLAIAALAHGAGTYTPGEIRTMLATAYVGFRAAVLEAERLGRVAEVHTGYWGCGAFGGNREMMLLLQLIAARAAGVAHLVLHVMDDAGLGWREVMAARVAALSEGAPAEVLVEHLAGLRIEWGNGDGT
jgi:hypothetical protein